VRILTLAAYLSKGQDLSHNPLHSFALDKSQLTSMQGNWVVRILTLSAYLSKGPTPYQALYGGVLTKDCVLAYYSISELLIIFYC
jgi:hypothetical protein